MTNFGHCFCFGLDKRIQSVLLSSSLSLISPLFCFYSMAVVCDHTTSQFSLFFFLFLDRGRVFFLSLLFLPTHRRQDRVRFLSIPSEPSMFHFQSEGTPFPS